MSCVTKNRIYYVMNFNELIIRYCFKKLEAISYIVLVVKRLIWFQLLLRPYFIDLIYLISLYLRTIIQ